MIDFSVQRVLDQLASEKRRHVLAARDQIQEIDMLTDEQFLRLYDNHIAAGYPDSYLQDARSQRVFLEWALTPPIQEVIDAHEP